MWVLVTNPGSTSTKIAIYEDERQAWKTTLQHTLGDLPVDLVEQLPLRQSLIEKELVQAGWEQTPWDAVVGRGGLTRPLVGGVYRVNWAMRADLTRGVQGKHASNLGGLLAWELAKPRGIPAFVVDPVVVDELDSLARLTGWPELERKSIFHCLNQKAVARRYAAGLGRRYEDLNLIVVHMGGGISVGVHMRGRVVDVNNALDGEGPYAVERSGTLPAGDLIRLAFSGKYTEKELLEKVVRGGGIVAYLGTWDAREVQKRIREGDAVAERVFRGMAYHTSKAIAAGAAVLSGEIDGIILTGGLAHSDIFVDWIQERVSFLAPVLIYPGEDEMLALAQGALRVLRGEEEAKEL